MPAEWAGRPVLVSWHLERPIYNFKILFPLVFSTFIEQNIFLPETCFAYTISEPNFMVCLGSARKSIWLSQGSFYFYLTQNFMFPYWIRKKLLCQQYHQKWNTVTMLWSKSKVHSTWQLPFWEGFIILALTNLHDYINIHFCPSLRRRCLSRPTSKFHHIQSSRCPVRPLLSEAKPSCI